MLLLVLLLKLLLSRFDLLLKRIIILGGSRSDNMIPRQDDFVVKNVEGDLLENVIFTLYGITQR